MARSLMDYLNAQIVLSKIDNITKQDFGDYMHDSTKTKEEKLLFLEQVELAGGYDALLDEF